MLAGAEMSCKLISSACAALSFNSDECVGFNSDKCDSGQTLDECDIWIFAK